MCRQLLDRRALLLDAGVAEHALAIGGETCFKPRGRDSVAVETIDAELEMNLVAKRDRLGRRRPRVLLGEGRRTLGFQAWQGTEQ